MHNLTYNWDWDVLLNSNIKAAIVTLFQTPSVFLAGRGDSKNQMVQVQNQMEAKNQMPTNQMRINQMEAKNQMPIIDQIPINQMEAKNQAPTIDQMSINQMEAKNQMPSNQMEAKNPIPTNQMPSQVEAKNQTITRRQLQNLENQMVMIPSQVKMIPANVQLSRWKIFQQNDSNCCSA